MDPLWLRPGKPSVKRWHRRSPNRRRSPSFTLPPDGVCRSKPTVAKRGGRSVTAARPRGQALDSLRAFLRPGGLAAGRGLAVALTAWSRADPDEAVEKVIDLNIHDTTMRARRRHVAYAGYFKDALVGNTLETVVHWSHNWVIGSWYLQHGVRARTLSFANRIGRRTRIMSYLEMVATLRKVLWTDRKPATRPCRAECVNSENAAIHAPRWHIQWLNRTFLRVAGIGALPATG